MMIGCAKPFPKINVIALGFGGNNRLQNVLLRKERSSDLSLCMTALSRRKERNENTGGLEGSNGALPSSQKAEKERNILA